MTTSIYDTIIVGAGAAGIAAGRKLHDAGYNVLILEARDRIGGRIHTDYTFADYPIELGAEFIHGDNAITHQLVKEAGLSTIPVERLGNLWWASPRDTRAHPYAETSDADLIERLKAAYARLYDADLATDISLMDYFRAALADASLDEAIPDVLFAQICCTDVTVLSCHDLQREMRAEHAGSGESRIAEGYLQLLEWYIQHIPYRLNSPVTEIRHDKSGVTVVANPEVFQAHTCIVTIPLRLLQWNAIRFDPPLAQGKQAAINHDLMMLPATKLILKFREQFWPDNFTYLCEANAQIPRWWTPGYKRKGEPVIIGVATAGAAIGLDPRLSLFDFSQHGLWMLSQLFGLSFQELKQNWVATKFQMWGGEEYTRGGYAYVPVGKADARVALAQPEGDKLFFAGEATAYDTNPQTVHGAIESGWRAAREVMERL
jgi:monoamine oxidase